MNKILLLAALCLLWLLPECQNIETMIHAPLVNVTGGFSANTISTFVPADSVAADPFALFLAGNMNISVLGTVNVPLSFAYTNQQLSKSVSLPFNRFSIAPSYKWVKVYAGYTAMSFSPYTLAGHEVFGGGVELSPENGLRVSALFGRLSRAGIGDNNTPPVYRRMGGGLKLEYQKEKYQIGVNVFKAQDLKNTLIFANPDSVPVLPQDNFTGGLTVGLNMLKNLNFNVEYGFSAVNRNISAGNGKFQLFRTDGDLAVYHALKSRVGYKLNATALGLTYEYVAPNYTTFGAYYMTNDFENVTVNMATTIRKITIAFDAGYQRNNLDNQKNSTTSRIIYSGNVSGDVTERLNLAFTFSNLQSFLYINDVYRQVTQTNPYQNLDTLNVTQLNFTGSLIGSYSLQNSDEQHQGLNAGFTYQRAAEKQQYASFEGNTIYNALCGYQFSHTPSRFMASVSLNYNYNAMPGDMYVKAVTYGATVGKTFFKLLKSSLTAGYSTMCDEKNQQSAVTNVRFSSGCVLLKKHSLNLAMTLLDTKTPIKKRTQYQLNLSYAYSFGMQLTHEDKKLRLKNDF